MIPNHTFESRLLFILDIFSNLYSQEEILTSCINFKLKNENRNYEQALKQSLAVLSAKDPISVLRKLNMQE